MKITRSRLLRASGALALSLGAGAAAAQDNTIRLLVGFAAGGMTDVVGRVIAQGLQAELGRNVVVENRPGAGGQIAAQALKAARPDGNTLFLTNNHTTAMIPLTTLNPGYDTAKDFAPVAPVATNPNFFIVNPAVVGAGVNDMKAFAAWAKANPGRANIGVPAPASSPEFAVVVMAQQLGADLKAAAYRGDAPLVQDLLGGQLAAGIAGVASALPHVKAGKLKLLAVDGPRRLQAYPDIPTYSEVGVKGLEDVIFIGVLAPAGTPPDLIARYNAAINKVVQSKAFHDRTDELGIVPLTGSPADMARLTEASRQANIPLVKAANFKPQ
ncbi:MAG TPA: Bug family tripartite tricarboxylate transporter substrate binding protein [Ramlibacter sp.]|nr:Bug family tripartite tricarboxylate transporter substrate binding protein [Ramlibacter sp.]